MATPHCPCRRAVPLDYSDKDPEQAAVTRHWIEQLGEFMVLTVGGRSYKVSRHCIALHGVTAEEIESYGFEKISWPDGGLMTPPAEDDVDPNDVDPPLVALYRRMTLDDLQFLLGGFRSAEAMLTAEGQRSAFVESQIAAIGEELKRREEAR